MTQTRKEKLMALGERIDEYFSLCDAVNAESKKTVKPYTLSGLMSYTGFTRGELSELAKSKRFGGILTNALSKIECFIEEKSLTGELSCNASMNSLKYNFGWGEKQTEERGDTQPKALSIVLSADALEMSE